LTTTHLPNCRSAFDAKEVSGDRPIPLLLYIFRLHIKQYNTLAWE
jgi:hypothetical protein